jgi:hypothetical protein
LLGKYLIYAFNDPRKYPTKPFLSKVIDDKPANKVMTPEEMERVAKNNTIKLGGKLK